MARSGLVWRCGVRGFRTFLVVGPGRVPLFEQALLVVLHGAKGSSLADLDKARRSFALRYHPDRVPEQFRDRAALRMQIANMLIDEAKRARR